MDEGFDPTQFGAVAVEQPAPFDPTQHGAIPVQPTEEPSVLQKTGRAVVDTLKGFLPQSVSDVALAPINMIPGLGQAVKPLENIAFGRPISEGVSPLNGIPVVQRIPQIIQAEKTPAGSQERYTAGAGVVADLAMIAGLRSAFHPEVAAEAGIPKPPSVTEVSLAQETGIAKPDIAQPSEPVATDAAAVQPVPEVAPPVPAAESVVTAPLSPEVFGKQEPVAPDLPTGTGEATFYHASDADLPSSFEVKNNPSSCTSRTLSEEYGVPAENVGLFASDAPEIAAPYGSKMYKITADQQPMMLDNGKYIFPEGTKVKTEPVSEAPVSTTATPLTQGSITPPPELGVIPRGVQSDVIPLLQNPKILDSVVGSVPVDVMDVLRREQGATEKGLSDHAVLLNALSSDTPTAVGIRASDSAVRTLASLGAKLGESGAVTGDVKLSPTLTANDLRPSEASALVNIKSGLEQGKSTIQGVEPNASEIISTTKMGEQPIREESIGGVGGTGVEQGVQGQETTQTRPEEVASNVPQPEPTSPVSLPTESTTAQPLPKESSGIKEPTPATVPTETGETPVVSDDQHVSTIANRFTEERTKSGELGEIAPGQGYSTKEMAAQGLKMSPEEINQHVSDLMNGTGDPIEQGKAVRAEEARLSQRSNDLSRAAAADPTNVESKLAADNAFKDVTDFHNGPVAKLKSIFHATGVGLQGELPIDMSTFNGMREAFLKDTGKPPTPEQEPQLKAMAEKVNGAQKEDVAAKQNLGQAIDKSTARRKLPSYDEVRQNIADRMKVEPCRV